MQTAGAVTNYRRDIANARRLTQHYIGMGEQRLDDASWI